MCARVQDGTVQALPGSYAVDPAWLIVDSHAPRTVAQTATFEAALAGRADQDDATVPFDDQAGTDSTKLPAAACCPMALLHGAKLLQDGEASPAAAWTELRVRSQALSYHTPCKGLWKWLRFVAKDPNADFAAVAAAAPMPVTDTAVMHSKLHALTF